MRQLLPISFFFFERRVEREGTPEGALPENYHHPPTSETKIKLYNTLYTRKLREIPTSHSENPNQPLRCKSRAWCNHIGDEAKARAQGTKFKVKGTRRSSRQRWDAKWRSRMHVREWGHAAPLAYILHSQFVPVFFFAVAPIVRTRDRWDESQGRNVSDDR